jgi:hypothetical protein
MSEPPTFQHLVIFSDLVDHIGRLGVAKEPELPNGDFRQQIRTLLSVDPVPPQPQDVRIETTWANHDLRGEEISWSAGFGPRTIAWIIRPHKNTERLPGVLALHGHDGVKWYGKEKIADGSEPVDSAIRNLREEIYEGRAFANALALNKKR